MVVAVLPSSAEGSGIASAGGVITGLCSIARLSDGSDALPAEALDVPGPGGPGICLSGGVFSRYTDPSPLWDIGTANLP